MRQRLVVIRDRGIVGCNVERARDLYCGVPLRQLPQSAEQALGRAAREHHAVAVGHPQRGSREHRQLALLLARRDDRQRVLAAALGSDAVRGQRAHEAAR